MKKVGVICALVAALSARAALAVPVGTAESLQGAVTADRAGTKLGLKSGDAIHTDDELTTGANAKIVVGFPDGTKLTLGPNANVLVDEYVFNPNGGGNSAVLKVAAGAVRVVSGAMERIGGPQSIKVNTPVATIGIRGTDFFIEQTPARLSVALFSGLTVDVTNAGGTTVLRPGEGTDVFGTLGPTPARPWAPDRINRALSLTSVTPAYERTLPYARPPAAAASLNDALTHGVFSADLRVRYENVDQANRPRTGESLTGRLRLGYETLAYNGLYAGLSGQITRNLSNPVRNDGVNGRADLPLIPDPSTEQLHEAYVGWVDRGADGLARTRIVAGRQRILYDNERWVGPSDFRQNAQSFDAVSAESQVSDAFSLRYAYLWQVNRILGNTPPNGRWRSDSHLIGATTRLVPYGVTTAYAYLLDLTPVPQLSSATTGLRYDGKITLGNTDFTLEAEFARQTDYGRNPRDYGLTYSLIKPGVVLGTYGTTTLSATWEQLRGNGLDAVQTPLGTLHRQNGWADVFTTTPPRGLREFSARWLQELPSVGPLKMPKLDMRFLDFASAGGPGAGLHYGHEWNADLNVSLGGPFVMGVRAARYEADRFDTDTTKVWVYFEAKY